MSIYIARHGQTDDNAARILQRPSSPLSELGHSQSQQLAARLVGENISHILCSDYLRTKQTAAHIAGEINADVQYEPLLRERNFGDLRGQQYDELNEHPFSPDLKPPNGENWSAFHSRINDAWQRAIEVYQSQQANLLIVTHGLVCHSLIQYHLSLTGSTPHLESALNTALTKVRGTAPWEIQLLNCIEHLDESMSHNSQGRA